MLSNNKIKSVVLRHFRSLGHKPLCTEYQLTDSIADVVSVNRNNYLYEIEIKRSLQDLRNDFNKSKHLIYSKNNNPRSLVPNYFYFCVTSEIYEKAKGIILHNGNPRYGLLVVDEKFPYKLSVAKKARLLTSEKLKDSTIMDIYRRLCNEVITFWEKESLK